MAKVEALQTKVKVLRAKAQAADKNTDKSKLAEARTLHKNLRRAQRKIRALTGRKLPAKKEEEGKKASSPTQAATAPAKPTAAPVAAATPAPAAAAAPAPEEKKA
ncbi:MAG: hypothetical protein AAB038_02935 [Planctomycetota bacterium]